jgi:uncharacterized membrane protein YdcZ (DUF606 family)
MENSIITGIQAIQAILAPALGISATALLLLSLQNRYSLIINRIRLLNEERRRYSGKIAQKTELEYAEKIRHMSVLSQIEKMLGRCKELRNAILLIQGSILLFVLTSVFIALNLFISSELVRSLPLFSFVAGMLFVLAGVIFSARDVYSSYKIAEIEVKADE